MIFKHLSKLITSTVNYSKYHIHSITRVSETCSENAVGKCIKVQGWVRALRKMKENIFLDLSDGSTAEMLQIVVPKSYIPEKLTYGCSIQVEGELIESQNNKIELQATDVKIIGTCEILDGYPFLPRKIYHADYVREYLHFRPRTRSFSSLLRLRDTATAAANKHLRSRGFINIHTPILTSNDCEGAGEIFLIKPDSQTIIESMKKDGQSDDEAYFNTKAFLTVSGQLQLEAAARAITKVYTFGPTFRAENSKSRLHLSEFYMIETEEAFITSIHNVAKEVELLIKAITSTLLDESASDFYSLGAKEPSWINKDFAFITYDEAINILKNNVKQLKTPVKYGQGLTKEHELFLVQHNNDVPIFVLEWPKENKPFYMRELDSDPSKVDALDLLAPNVGEIAGGSMRIVEYEKLKANMPSDKLNWYADIRKFGNVPTGGFGMGFERFLQCVLGTVNIKDTIPFPRWPHHCDL